MPSVPCFRHRSPATLAHSPVETNTRDNLPDKEHAMILVELLKLLTEIVKLIQMLI